MPGWASALARGWLVAEPLSPGTTLTELRELRLSNPLRHVRSPPHNFWHRFEAPVGERQQAPPGRPMKHLRILLDDEEDGRLLHVVAEHVAQADVPPLAFAALRVGCMVALRKSGGGVQALVVGDVLGRLTGRLLAQAYATQLQQACLPFQFGLSTRAGTEALARVLTVATELDPRATVLSVDAAGAYDHVSRGAMLEALHARPELQPLLPYAGSFMPHPAPTRGSTPVALPTSSPKRREGSRETP